MVKYLLHFDEVGHGGIEKKNRDKALCDHSMKQPFSFGWKMFKVSFKGSSELNVRTVRFSQQQNAAIGLLCFWQDLLYNAFCILKVIENVYQIDRYLNAKERRMFL